MIWYAVVLAIGLSIGGAIRLASDEPTQEVAVKETSVKKISQQPESSFAKKIRTEGITIQSQMKKLTTSFDEANKVMERIENVWNSGRKISDSDARMLSIHYNTARKEMNNSKRMYNELVENL
jgi:hypothetical protein